jgi:predicted methyltransferase
LALFPRIRRARDEYRSDQRNRRGKNGESNLLHNPADDHKKTVFDPAIHFKTDQFILKFARP